MSDPTPTRAELLPYVQDGNGEMLLPAAWLRALGAAIAPEVKLVTVQRACMRRLLETNDA